MTHCSKAANKTQEGTTWGMSSFIICHFIRTVNNYQVRDS